MAYAFSIGSGGGGGQFPHGPPQLQQPCNITIDLFHYYLYKIFERIIFDNIYKYLDEHNLLNPNQSGFRPKDSCLSINGNYPQHFFII